MRALPDTYIATEINLDTGATKLHEICVVGYRQHLSACQFSSGRRAGVSASDLALHRSTPAWAPDHKLYILKHAEIWKLDQAIAIGARLGDSLMEVLEVVPHETLWGFYQHIGYDYRTKRYRDAQGRPVRYSVTGRASAP